MRDAHEDKIYIDGRWTDSDGTGRIPVIDAATEAVIGHVPEGTAEDVDRAVSAARAAFPTWSATPSDVRGKILTAVSAAILARTDELATLQSREVGTPLPMSKGMHVGLPAATFGSQAEYLAALEEEQVGSAVVVREPIGVVGLITPWNFPLQQVAAKVAPALAAGCTVVLKPSEVAPLSAFILVDIFEEAGLPAGVFNLVTGYGPVVGEAIAGHPDLDMVSFTGSTAVGKQVMVRAADTVKRVALELGGKSPLVILPDADLAAAAERGVRAAYLNSGQTCSALTRMVVPRSKLKEVEDLVASVVEGIKVGNPFEEGTELGPLISERQRERVLAYIQLGIDEGARVVVGGLGDVEGQDKGFYVRPTVFSDVTPEMRIAQEEIFGPVLVIEPYDDSVDAEENAVRIANDTVYGLAAGVFAKDPERAKAVARKIRAGQVEVNGGAFQPFAPFGGYKQSGNGRELGRSGLDEYLESKALLL